MNAGRTKELLALSISPSAVRANGNLTIPRSYGVYRLTGSKRSGRLHRFGNHPVRLQELIRDYGGASLEALFTNRKHAEELASLWNRSSK
jgi:hypothetical protein